ncbi:MAG: STAS domain-containing protein [Acidimicrobiia bacterium]
MTGPARWGVTYGRRDGAVVVAVRGELDIEAAPALRRGFADLIDGQGNSSLVVDLGGVQVIGSTGVSVLVEAHGRSQRLGGTITLVNAPPAAWAALLSAGLLDLFDFGHQGSDQPAPRAATG